MLTYDEGYNVAYCHDCRIEGPDCRPITETELRKIWHKTTTAKCAHCDRVLFTTKRESGHGQQP